MMPLAMASTVSLVSFEDRSLDTIVPLADLFRLLGDPTRLRIVLACVDERRAVGAIAEGLGLSPSLVSHHLRLLRAARIVRAERQGKQVFILPPTVISARCWPACSSMWPSRPANFLWTRHEENHHAEPGRPRTRGRPRAGVARWGIRRDRWRRCAGRGERARCLRSRRAWPRRGSFPVPTMLMSAARRTTVHTCTVRTTRAPTPATLTATIADSGQSHSAHSHGPTRPATGPQHDSDSGQSHSAHSHDRDSGQSHSVSQPR